jgi:hypothetical protein
MDIAEILGRGKSDTDSDLPEEFQVPDYPPTDDADDASGPVEADLLEPDPAPRRGKKTTRSAPVRKVTLAQKGQIEDACALILTTIGGGISLRDQHCGPALTEHADNAAKKLVPIIARNPRWVEWFCGSTGFLDVMGLVMAFRPVLVTMWSHHVTHTIGEGVEQLDYSKYAAPDL